MKVYNYFVRVINEIIRRRFFASAFSIFAIIIYGVLYFYPSFAHAALTFSGTTISGDSNIVIDGSSGISIGTSTATAINIGSSIANTTFPGNVSIFGNNGLIISNSTSPEGVGEFFSIYEATDTINTGDNATFFAPSSASNRRLYFGSAMYPFYALNFSNVSVFENTPTLTLVKGSYIEWGDNTGDDSITTNDHPAWSSSTNNVMTFQTYDGVGTGDFIFRGSNSGNTWMTIKGSNGNVGIGTITPSSTLHVAGGVTVTGSSTFVLGTSTQPTNNLMWIASPSSTVRIGVTSTWPGCIEMYDAANSSTLDYAYFSNGTMVVTSTKPSFCI